MLVCKLGFPTLSTTYKLSLHSVFIIFEAFQLYLVHITCLTTTLAISFPLHTFVPKANRNSQKDMSFVHDIYKVERLEIQPLLWKVLRKGQVSTKIGTTSHHSLEHQPAPFSIR